MNGNQEVTIKLPLSHANIVMMALGEQKAKDVIATINLIDAQVSAQVQPAVEGK